MVSYPSFCLHVSAWLPVHEFPWNLVLGTYMKNLMIKFKFGQNRTKISGTLLEAQSTRVCVCVCVCVYRVSRGNVPDFGRMFLTLKYTAITQNTYIRSWTVTEIMAREKCGLLVVPRTVPVLRVVTRTLRMSVLQSRSRVKHMPPSLSTDVTVTVNCNSILLDIHVPCKVLGTLRTTTTLVRVYVV